MRLFVIGNGFDLNLGLNTEYRDFYHYLKNNYPDFLLEMGEILWAENETDNLWCNFEKELAQVNFIPFTSEEGYKSDISIAELHNLTAEEIESWKKTLSNCFKEWLFSSYKIPTHRNYNFSNDDYFLNFNYTPTLEDCFQVNRQHIMYLHGNIHDSGRDLIFGHGLDHDLMSLCRDLNLVRNGELVCSLSQLNDLLAVDLLLSSLRKPVDEIKKEMNQWLDTLPEITEIIVLGHSLGDVDMPYFVLLRSKVNRSTRWTFSYRTDSRKSRIYEKISYLHIHNFRIGKIDELIGQCGAE